MKALWDKLSAEGIVSGNMPEPKEADVPWFLKILQAFCGWLAAIFMLGFVGVGLTFIMESEIGALILGSVFIFAACKLLKESKNDFIEHMALAVSLCGQCVVIYAFAEMMDFREESLAFAIGVLQGVLAIYVPSFVHRVLSSVASVVSFSVSAIYAGAPYIVSGVAMLLAARIWLTEFSFPKQIHRMRAIGYGMIFAVIIVKGMTLFGYSIVGAVAKGSDVPLWVPPWVSEVFSAVVLIYVTRELLQVYGRPLTSRFALTLLAGAVLFSAVSFEAPGISLGLTIIVLGFTGSNLVLQGVGVLSLIYYVSCYYYLLEITLMDKSIILFGTGVVLLVLRWFVVRALVDEEGTSDA